MGKGTELGSGDAGVNKIKYSQTELTYHWGGPQYVHRERSDTVCGRKSSTGQNDTVSDWRVASLRR